jgi:hypothetical protein
VIDISHILSSLPSSKPKSKKGKIWTGHIDQHGRSEPIVFKKFSIKDGKVKGKGVDREGKFELKGKVHKDNGVDFKKEYKGRRDDIEFSGKIHDNKIKGECTISHVQGTFEIEVRI